MAGAFQNSGFQNTAFQTDSALVPARGGQFAQGGGRRNLPNLEDLEVFKCLERRKPGQSVIECLRLMDAPAAQEVIKEAKVEAERIVRPLMRQPNFAGDLRDLQIEFAALQGMLREQEETRRRVQDDEDDDDFCLMACLL